MAALSGPLVGDSTDNPLHGDPVLFDMYQDGLDIVLRRPEIRQACDEFGLPPATLRMRLTYDAAHVLSSAPREFDTYQQAAAQRKLAAAGPDQVTHGTVWQPGDFMRLMVRWGMVSGLLAVTAGAVSSVWWGPLVTLAEAGATVLVVASLIWAVPRFLTDGEYLGSLGYF